MIERYQIPEGELKSKDFAVEICGEACEAYSARVIGICKNDPWDGRQTPKKYTEMASFVTFAFRGKAEFAVTPLVRAFTECKVRPLSKGIKPVIRDSVIYFTVTEPGQYTLELNDERHALHIFADPIREKPEKENFTYYFEKGIHRPGKISLNSGESVYIEPGAVVYGSVFGKNVSNVTISGGGVLDGSWEERANEKCYEEDTTGTVKFYGSKNIKIEGIVCRDSAIWCVNFFDCDDVSVDNVKIIGMWRRNTDGIDVCSSRNVLIRNCFLRTYDDSIVVKGIPGYGYRNVENVRAEKCVVWCDWGRALEVGAETVADEMSGIIFEDCDLIHGTFVALDVQNCDRARVHDVVFRNIRVEYPKDERPFQVLIAAIVINGYYGVHFDDPNVVGRNDGILFENITAVVEEANRPLQIVLTGFDKDHLTENVTIRSLTVNGERAADGKNVVVTSNEFTKNIVLE